MYFMALDIRFGHERLLTEDSRSGRPKSTPGIRVIKPISYEKLSTVVNRSGEAAEPAVARETGVPAPAASDSGPVRRRLGPPSLAPVDDRDPPVRRALGDS